MGKRIREFDWSNTPLGDVSTWPQSLRSVASICSNSNFPIAIYWGPDLILIYNDSWSPIPGNKHPWALGRPAREVWPDIWDAIEPQFQKAFSGEPGGSKDALLPMQRHGYTEECYFDFTFTPVSGEDGKVDGIFNAVIETTYRVINERRSAFLKNLALHIASAQSLDELYQQAIEYIIISPEDVSFSILYNAEGAELASTYNDYQLRLTKPWPFSKANDSGLELIENIEEYAGNIPRSYWPEPIKEAVIISLKRGNIVDGYVVCGLSARRRYDRDYRIFFETISNTISTVANNIVSLQEERKRAQALAEIDQAKTTFFSNISHEFRTPLTLILGPLHDALSDPATIEQNKARLQLAHRNALRMQKLVNTLLEFSRIEAGRAEGKFSRVDIASITRDLASTFRSAIERAGLELRFDFENINEPVYVDIEMWEKIVLNLVSNAFKYTHGGSIEIGLKKVDHSVEISVSDTGVGIPANEVNKIFNRFHRIDNTQGRSQEGTGIGLALVKELVKIQHGEIYVSSTEGVGSTFRIVLPTGREHLPDEKIIKDGKAVFDKVNAYAEEAKKWLTVPGSHFLKNNNTDSNSDQGDHKPKIVLADDNPDMREYVERLLDEHYIVVSANDGDDAFEKITEYRPDLVLSDIMMPKVDGIELLNKIRNHPELNSTPVILLSARAGEDATVEGLNAGADDYLIKPFIAKELLAVVNAHIKISRSRLAVQKNLENLFMQAPISITIMRGDPLRFELVNNSTLELWGKAREEVIGKSWFDVFPELKEQGYGDQLKRVIETNLPLLANEQPVVINRKSGPVLGYYNYILQPLVDEVGVTAGIMTIGIDVSDQVIAREKIAESERSFSEIANALPQLVWVANKDGEVLYYNNRVEEFAGAHKNEKGNWSWTGLVHPEDIAKTENAWNKALMKGSVYQIEHRVQMKNGEYRWHLSRGIPQKDEHGNVVKWFGTATDVHSAKEQSSLLEDEVKQRTKELHQLNLSLQQSNNDLQQFAHVASHDLKEPLRKIRMYTGRLESDPENVLSKQSKGYMEKVYSAANRMSIMIDGVLNYSTLNVSEQKIEPVDLNLIIDDIKSDLEILVTEKSATITHSTLPVIEGANVLFYQLFYNLINNSLKFSKAGIPQVVTITSEPIQSDNGESVQISVRDIGIGFEQEQAQRIFKTFERLNSKDRYEGTGLGLSLCKSIVQRHQGTIHARGKENEFAEFIIQLPVKQNRASL